MIVETDNYVAFCPFAAATPFEMAIYPRRHAASFILLDDDEIRELGWILRTVALKIYNCLNNPDYYFVVRSAPAGDEGAPYLHWQIDIIPRLFLPMDFALLSAESAFCIRVMPLSPSLGKWATPILAVINIVWPSITNGCRI